MPLETEFDAIVGRLIFIHLHSPAAVLQRLAEHLRPGGIVAFQEFDLAHFATTPVHPSNPLIEQVYRWNVEAFRRAGLPIRMGLDLYTVFLDAGLPAPKMSGEATIIAGPEWVGYDWAAETIRTVLPLLLKFGLATSEEVGIESLAERMRNEAISQRLVLRGPDIISAWTCKPAPAGG
jgi:SAM-dependent methyltransferase